ncbi:MAG: multidrug efflux RND transporter permease subunit [Bacteroidales bacterium]|nr:multidrug efflux RND transporter permease subunit [Bacteroidales bacterium]
MLQQFIQRPVLSFVIAILITLVGVLSLMVLPVAQYPDVVPPTVQVTAYYPGASAEVVQKTVAVPLEEQINGVEDMMYMTSQCANDGSCNITVYFDVGTDPDMATVNTQNRAQRAYSLLPAEVTQGGVTVMKRNPSILMLYALSSQDTSYNFEFLSNYAQINIVNVMKRIDGVGDVSLLGGDDYAMRIWLNPERMAGLSITTDDVANAIRDQNLEAAAGAIGKSPAVPGQELSYIIRAEGRLHSIEEFNNIIIKTKSDGSIVRMEDIARVELGLKTYDVRTRFNTKPSPFIAVYQSPGSNATQVRAACDATMEELASQFPPGLEYEVGLDTVEFVDASIEEVLKTLLEAFVLVFLVVFIFLQDWRATLIPAVTVPVSLIGALAAFQLFGFSINMLTLFALVLAIGIVVDDAIVVLEAVQEKIDEHGMSPLEATKETMREIAGAIFTITLVLSAVFIPVSFLGGTTGQMYKQFALTLTSSIIISGLLALTLSPAMCVLLLKPKLERKGLIGKFFNGFDKAFGATTTKYIAIVNNFLHHISRPILFLGIVIILMVLVMKFLPTGFLPDEDQGYFFVNVITPKGVSLEKTDTVMRRVERILEKTAGVQSFSSVPGYSILDGTVSTTSGAVFVKLTPWKDRTEDSLNVESIIAKVQSQLSLIPNGICMAFNAPAISGLGTTGGLELQLEDKAGAGLDKLAEVTAAFAVTASQNKMLSNVFTGFRIDIPQYFLTVNKEKAKTMGIPISEIYGALQAQFGSLYVNDYNQFGKSYRVIIQADAVYRSNPEDINRIYVRSNTGNMVPLGTLVSLESIEGPDVVRRFNLYSSSSFTIAPAAGYSSGQAIGAVKEVAEETLPFGFGYEYSGLTRQELIAGDEAPFVFALCFIFVYLLLAAKYESWFLPLPILMALPFGILGAFGLQWVRGLQNNIYAQIGLIMLIGLIAKNAILIVEYARQKHLEGMELIKASEAAAKLRFRPILMTSFAFILGVVPLVIAGGAGAASRHALGTSVFGGMLMATICGVLVVPTLYVMFQRIENWIKGRGTRDEGRGTKDEGRRTRNVKRETWDEE